MEFLLYSLKSVFPWLFQYYFKATVMCAVSRYHKNNKCIKTYMCTFEYVQCNTFMLGQHKGAVVLISVASHQEGSGAFLCESSCVVGCVCACTTNNRWPASAEEIAHWTTATVQCRTRTMLSQNPPLWPPIMQCNLNHMTLRACPKKNATGHSPSLCYWTGLTVLQHIQLIFTPVLQCLNKSIIIPILKSSRISYLNDCGPTAPVSVVVMSFECIIITHLKTCSIPLMDPFNMHTEPTDLLMIWLAWPFTTCIWNQLTSMRTSSSYSSFDTIKPVL